PPIASKRRRAGTLACRHGIQKIRLGLRFWIPTFVGMEDVINALYPHLTDELLNT
ncbi:MAG: hypothetical protein HY663_04055, partial [Chloroflexi bacterium]|nr:hypothetical protein [Chloroflexota bacterium]